MEFKYSIHFYAHTVWNVAPSQPNIMVSELSTKSDAAKQIGGSSMRRDLQCRDVTIYSRLDVEHCAVTVASI